MKKKNGLLQTFFYNFKKIQVTNWVREILVTCENQLNHGKIVATEIIDDILKGAVKTDNNSTKPKHKTFVTVFHICICTGCAKLR
jgi:hypothetical protein